MASSRPPSSQSENTPPVDLEATFTGVDEALRSVARAAVDLERSRIGARTREASRIAAKYGADHPRARAAVTAVRVQRAHLAEATRLAGRADVAPIEIGATEIAIIGRVIDASGAGRAGLTVHAAAPDGRVLASSNTDARGQFRLTGKRDAPGPTDTGAKAPPTVGTNGQGDVVLVVLRETIELYRDAQAFTVNPGLVLYREITVVEA